MKRSTRLPLLIASASGAAAVASLYLALLEATPSGWVEAANTTDALGKYFFIVAAAYAGLSAAIGLNASKISSIARRLTRRYVVVIAHTYEENDYVESLSQALSRYRIHTWSVINDILPGDQIFSAIDDRIRDSDGLLVVSSPGSHSIEKRWVAVARKAGKRVIPVIGHGDTDLQELREYAPVLRDAPVAKTARRIAEAVKYGSSPRRSHLNVNVAARGSPK